MGDFSSHRFKLYKFFALMADVDVDHVESREDVPYGIT
jgi:hypothetical protein